MQGTQSVATVALILGGIVARGTAFIVVQIVAAQVTGWTLNVTSVVCLACLSKESNEQEDANDGLGLHFFVRLGVVALVGQWISVSSS